MMRIVELMIMLFAGFVRKDQQQDLQATGNRSSKPEHAAPSPHSRAPDEGRGTRSRDSSRSRKKNERAIPTEDNQRYLPVPGLRADIFMHRIILLKNHRATICLHLSL